MSIRVVGQPAKILSPKQAAEILGISNKTVLKLIREQKIRAKKVSRTIIRIWDYDIDRYMHDK